MTDEVWFKPVVEDPLSTCSGFEGCPEPEMTFILIPDSTPSLQYSGVL